MSDTGADAHVVDISATFTDAVERDALISWGAAFLRDTDEDRAIRSASLALEFRDLAFRAAKARGARMNFWQARLTALAMVTACVRFKQATETPTDVRH
jgi:hypothetical protein